MKKIPFNLNWERLIGEKKEFWQGESAPKIKVNLPDDFIINLPRSKDVKSGASTGFFPGGRAVYTKIFDVPEDWADKSVILDIDGAYMNAEATLNGEALGIHPYGYTPWLIDLDKAIIPGEKNEIEIITRCVEPNSRWYSGGGLFREVNLWTGCGCHIRPWDLFVTTPFVNKERAMAHISAVLTNTSLKTAEGNFSACLCGEKTSVHVSLPARETVKVELDIELKNPALWSAEKPTLHKLNVVALTNLGEDFVELQTGIRKIEIDSRYGMRVNGNPVKLLGGCIHHDNTLLGSAAFPRAEERKIELLKSAGYNAVRFAHNPPSSAILEACDRIGMYAIDESFDCWRTGKNDLDYHLYFEDWWQRDTAAMVKRDRNHPSVFCWSVGNELPEQGGRSEGAALTKMQADFVHSLDPTRPVMTAIHSMISSKREKGKPSRIPFKQPEFGNKSKEEITAWIMQMTTAPDGMEKIMDIFNTNNKGDGFVDGEDIWSQLSEASASALDIVGYNYLFNRYSLDHKKYPDRVAMGTETHAHNTYDYYKAMMNNPNVIGDFIWTAYDNLGEAGVGRVMHGVQDLLSGIFGPWPWLSCYQGDFDLDGNRRPQSYYRKIMWGKDKGIHLFARDPKFSGRKEFGLGWQWSNVYKNWTWPDEYTGKEIDIEAYADCEKIEFILNGKSLDKVPVEKLTARFTLPYEAGTLKATAWKDGVVIAEDSLITAGKAVRIELTADRKEIAGDSMDLCFVKARLVDANGITVPANDVELSTEVTGGTLAGFGSGNPCTDENYGTGRRRLWNGLALICLRAPETSGIISLKVNAPGLPEAAINVMCK